MSVEEGISGYEKLTSVFGHWPSFHDAEVLWIRLDRGDIGNQFEPTLDVLIHVHQMTKEIGPTGHYVLRHHCLAHFRFHDVVELKLEHFNNQNVLWDLEISDIRELQMERVDFDVSLASSFGVSASFQCHRIELMAVTPCREDATPSGDEIGRKCHV